MSEAKRLSRMAGLAPGTLVHIGEKRGVQPKITLMDYSESDYQERTLAAIEESFPFKDTSTVTWLNIDGVHETGIIEKIGARFNLHPLTLEDIAHTAQRPKFEDYGEYIYVVLKMLYNGDNGNGDMVAEQVSIILGKNYVISFQEQEGDVFNLIRERIRKAKGRIRKMGADYLAYSLLDAIVDNYFLILEKYGEKIEDLEETLTVDSGPEDMRAIHNMKRTALFLRKSIWPLREMVSSLIRGESLLISRATGVYLRDVYDHAIQVIDTVETFRDMVSGMLDIYLSSVSNRMNEVMKVLTIIATIFIPLTFVAGIYGMNFNPQASHFNMPELEWKYGYFFALGIMVLIALAMLAYFRRKKWL
ncbi:MAG: magnesium/cobalt transporter CorA [Candidatus Omnitrophota bacterium]